MNDQVKSVAGVHEGDLLAGKYRIERILGAGGMGVVVAARHIHLDDQVAIKFLLPETLGNADAVARFGREARAAVKIKSEHVARVADVGTLENGAPYMVMEYLDGSDLSDWLHKKGALPFDQAAEFVLQACEAIAEAHALGIVHRDLKPANLFVVRRADGVLSVKVLDFGISKISSPSGMDMTKTSSVMGSPLYMSPEQMQSSKDVDPRSDIWAIGVILYELLSGDSPFMAQTMPELVARILSAPPEPLRNRRPDAPAALEAVILKCLERDRARRFQNIGELALALVPFAPRRAKASLDRISGVMRSAGISQSSPTSMAPPSEPSVAAPPTGAGLAMTAASWERTASKLGSSKAKLGVIAALVGIVGIGAIVFVKRAAQAPEAIATASSSVTAAPAPSPVEKTNAPEPVAPKTAESPAVTPSAELASHVAPHGAPHRGGKHDTAPTGKTEAPAAPAPAAQKPSPAKPTTDSLFDDRQ
jgi:serine/threonine-protein kinase